MITVITPTGDRYEAFKLCIRWLTNQLIMEDVKWLIIDDGITQATEHALADSMDLIEGRSNIKKLSVNYIHRQSTERERTPGNGPLSLAANILEARYYIKNWTKHLGEHKIFIFEDDDWYSPVYLPYMIRKMDEGAEATGTHWLRYYHLQTRTHRTFRNHGSALCSTGLDSKHFHHLTDAAMEARQRNDKGIDAKFWNKILHGNIPHYIEQDRHFCIGMKGLPGRMGIGVGHQAAKRRFTPDPGCRTLTEWVGEAAAKLYQEIDYANPWGRSGPS